MKILLADNDDSLRETLSQALENRGHWVATAGDGAAALAALERERFDMLVTAMIMPVKEGVETIAAARRAYPDLKIIAMSGGGRARITDLLQLAVKAGADETIRKPFRPEQLVEIIERGTVRIILPAEYAHRLSRG